MWAITFFIHFTRKYSWQEFCKCSVHTFKGELQSTEYRQPNAGKWEFQQYRNKSNAKICYRAYYNLLPNKLYGILNILLCFCTLWAPQSPILYRYKKLNTKKSLPKFRKMSCFPKLKRKIELSRLAQLKKA